MMQKHRIKADIGNEHLVTVELKQDFDLLEILSLKFSQKDVYTSLCADYGVVCGRITANNGLGIPNARVSIFVPISDSDSKDPVISKLYPYSSTSDKNDDGYRYNLFPSRKQHGGHVPTGTFPDQTDILEREEVLEVYDKYYNFTVKTNIAGDFMIWGVPLGSQQIHVDIDLSDMGCFSLRPYDFIRQGIDENQFDRFYNFKSDEDVDGLPQIISFSKTIEVYPFWGNIDLCQIGITRTDFDLSERGIKVHPISLVLVSSITDNDGDAVKRTGVIRMKTGYKCNLETKPGNIEGVRYTGRKVYGTDGSLYPELEYFSPGVIDDNGAAMAVIPMNMEFMYTNEFGEPDYTNDPNKGVPTTTTARFRMGLNVGNQTSGKGTQPANYLIPNIREFNTYTGGGNGGDGSFTGEYSEAMISTYTFSDVFEDYFNTPRPNGLTLESMTTAQRTHKKELMLGTLNDNVPEDYFYKFIYGKIYTPSSFQGSHYEVSAVESFFGLSRRDAFLGIKEIRPNGEDDCSGNANYFPTNFGFRNRIKFGLIISQVLLFVQFVYSIVLLKFAELVGSFFWSVADFFYSIYLGWPFNWRPFEKFSEQLRDLAYRIADRLTQQLPLTIYPDCEECTTDDDSITSDSSSTSNYCRVGEIKLRIAAVSILGNKRIVAIAPDALSSSLYKNAATDPSLLTIAFPNETAKDNGGECVYVSSPAYSLLSSLHTLTTTVPDDPSTNFRYVGQVYPSPSSGNVSFTPFVGFFQTTVETSTLQIKNKTSFSGIELLLLNGLLQTMGYSTSANGKAMVMTNQKWLDLTGVNVDEGGALPDYIVIRIYDRSRLKTTTDGNEIKLEVGCEKYDTLYNEATRYKHIWGTGLYGSVKDPLTPPTYSTGFAESVSSPGSGYTILSTIGGDSSTRRLPLKQKWNKIPNATYDRKTKSGLSEVRDGVFTIIPVIEGTTKNTTMIQEWYRRKRVGLFFCGGVLNYSYIDNWLHGLLYFFKFDYRLRWDDVNTLDLSQRGSRFPRELVFFNVLDQKFYYRSTPYNPTTKQYVGQSYSGYKELLHPTTFYDVGVRDEFFDEICFDPRVDPTCSVIRDLTVSSYQDPGYVLEHVINYRMDTSAAKFDIGDFFNGGGYDFGKVLDGDVQQLISINCEAGIEAFDLDTTHYFLFNGEFMDPEDPTYAGLFKIGGNWGPTPIDFKLDKNGRFLRLCLNNRLGDYTQKVPFFLWNKNGEGFGTSDSQKWDRNAIGSQKLQRMVSVGNPASTTTNYLMADGEEEYIIKPMTITHPTYSTPGNFTDMLERFEVISQSGVTPSNPTRYIEGDLWLEVLTYGPKGYKKDPYTGRIYVLVNQQWVGPISYISNQGTSNQEVFVFQTAKNYSGSYQVLSTPFHFYFGLRPGSTSYDKFIKYYGPKGAFPSGE